MQIFKASILGLKPDRISKQLSKELIQFFGTVQLEFFRFLNLEMVVKQL